MVGTISCADFLLALKRYREEVGVPKLARDVLPKNFILLEAPLAVRSASTPREVKATEKVVGASKRAEKEQAKQKKREITEKQGSLW